MNNKQKKEKESFYATFSKPFIENSSNLVGQTKYNFHFSKKHEDRLKFYRQISNNRSSPKIRGLSEAEKRKLLLAEINAVNYDPFTD
jgi:hypothetical protein